MILAKAKNILQGYSTPKPFDISESEKCIEYDTQVVDHWLSHLEKYLNVADAVVGKDVLELGPGSDLGIGIYLLSKGCSRYNACDVNDLMKSTPDSFYVELLEKLKRINSQTVIDSLNEQLKLAQEKKPSQLNYVVRDDFNLVSAFGNDTIDLVFSQAAFEHFDDVHTTFSQLSAVCKKDAILVAEIDLKTHSRWVRDEDPNGIYRFSSWLYNIFWFRGIPNRVRPYQYKEALERCGWIEISLTPLKKLADHKTGASGMSKKFTDEKNQMDYLEFILCARKG